MKSSTLRQVRPLRCDVGQFVDVICCNSLISKNWAGSPLRRGNGLETQRRSVELDRPAEIVDHQVDVVNALPVLIVLLCFVCSAMKSAAALRPRPNEMVPDVRISLRSFPRRVRAGTDWRPANLITVARTRDARLMPALNGNATPNNGASSG